MPDLVLIARAIDFVEANLKEPIGVADMADAVGYSLFHFSRTFNEATHHTPYDYLMRRRLAEAARALLQTDDKIIDIAFDYQFNNPETFSRAFKRVFDTQPSQWRKDGYLDRWRLRPKLTLAHITHLNKGTYLRSTLVNVDVFHLAGLMTLVREDQAVIPELWELLAQDLKGADVSLTGETYGLRIHPDGWEKCGFLYLAAAEVREPTITDAALVVKTIPALSCARFVHKGPKSELSLTLDYVFHTWLPKSGQRLSQPWIIEHYPQDFAGADDSASETEILIPII